MLRLNEVERRGVSSGDLLLPLALAYCCSSFLRVRFPFPVGALRRVERTFDRVLVGLPVRSKGIGYEMECTSDERLKMLAQAELILTTDELPQPFHRRPHLLIRGDEIERRFTERLPQVNWPGVIVQAKALAGAAQVGVRKSEYERERNWKIRHDLAETNKRQLARFVVRGVALPEVPGNLAR
ncbi:MAG TPA: hypothetical protein PLD20_32915 [Blastocatellia bacterium]|nr:hypothetical protein [Blastocatellia bacterium]HMZ22776.1 hypothetical protein [Blastocatellia bacterium]HNG28368.1 hypothetical protein [Blastocatellia bacterium]